MNKEELKKKISDIPIKLSTEEILTGQVEEVIATVLDLIDQLDEPEKVVVPQFVAEWIKRQLAYGYENVFIAMNRVMECDSDRLINWFSSNQDTYARAWLDGYMVEKEEKYYLIFPSFDELGRGFNYLAKDTTHRNLWVDDSRTDGLDWENRSCFTESEIRDMEKGDILFEHFAVKVKERTNE